MSSLMILLWLLTEVMNIANHPRKKSFRFDILTKYTMFKKMTYLTRFFFGFFEVLHNTRVYDTFWFIVSPHYTSIVYYWFNLLISLLNWCHKSKIIVSLRPVRVGGIIILLFICWWAYMLVTCWLTIFANFEEISYKTRYVYLDFFTTQQKRSWLAKLLSFS